MKMKITFLLLRSPKVAQFINCPISGVLTENNAKYLMIVSGSTDIYEDSLALVFISCQTAPVPIILPYRSRGTLLFARVQE